MKTGVDISHWQATFNAAQYKASGEDFIILKASESTNYRDPTFNGRWDAAHAANLARGAYHFAHPASPVQPQVDYFVNTVRAAGWRDGDVFILDLEGTAAASVAALISLHESSEPTITSPRQDVPWEVEMVDTVASASHLDVEAAVAATRWWEWAHDWVSSVRAALGGRGLFYTYPYFWRDYLGNETTIPGGALGWWARYAATPYGSLGFTVRGFTDPPAVWQCSNGQSGCIKDVVSIGRCDYNRMTDAAFAELFGGGEPDVTPEEHDALMWLRANAASLRDQGVRMTAHGDPDVPANRTVNNLANVLGKLDAVTGTLVEHSAEHDAHTDMLTALAPDALVQSILSGLVAQGVVIPADIDHALLVEDMKIALQGMTQKFEPVSFDG